MARELTQEQLDKLNEAMTTDGIFHVIELAIDHALEQMPELELGEDEYICWHVEIGKEIGDDDPWEATGRGPEPMLDKP
jgi:hypothetical protein